MKREDKLEDLSVVGCYKKETIAEKCGKVGDMQTKNGGFKFKHIKYYISQNKLYDTVNTNSLTVFVLPILYVWLIDDINDG